VNGLEDVEAPVNEGLKFAFEQWDGPDFVAGGFDAESARRFVDEQVGGRNVVGGCVWHFTSTPDLVFRIQEGVAFAPYRRGVVLYVQGLRVVCGLSVK
jgi:NADPH2 dehydrogenase